MIRDYPPCRRSVVALGVGSLLLGAGMLTRGPWFSKLMPFYWIIYAGTITACVVVNLIAFRRHRVAFRLPVLQRRIALPEHGGLKFTPQRANRNASASDNG